MDRAFLKKQLAQTPQMTPQDAVKLVYQAAFGCGHLLCGDCAAGVAGELSRTPVRPGAAACRPIGGGWCRLNLACGEVHGIPAERIAQMMRLSAARSRGGEAFLKEGLEALRVLAQAGETPFSAGALAAFLRSWDRMPLHHSAAYRAAYAPAYRVVAEDFGTLALVIAQTERHLAARERALVVLDGPCGSGKTTLAGALGELYHTDPIRMDDFFLPPDLRTPERLGRPGGNVHFERFRQEVLGGLLRGGDVAYRRYDCQSGAWLPATHPTGPVTLIEGSYSHHPFFRETYEALGALRVFVHATEGERLRRLAARDPQRLPAFLNRWIPLEKTYFEAYDIRSGADIVLQSQPWA